MGDHRVAHDGHGHRRARAERLERCSIDGGLGRQGGHPRHHDRPAMLEHLHRGPWEQADQVEALRHLRHPRPVRSMAGLHDVPVGTDRPQAAAVGAEEQPHLVERGFHCRVHGRWRRCHQACRRVGDQRLEGETIGRGRLNGLVPMRHDAGECTAGVELLPSAWRSPNWLSSADARCNRHHVRSHADSGARRCDRRAARRTARSAGRARRPLDVGGDAGDARQRPDRADAPARHAADRLGRGPLQGGQPQRAARPHRRRPLHRAHGVPAHGAHQQDRPHHPGAPLGWPLGRLHVVRPDRVQRPRPERLPRLADLHGAAAGAPRAVRCRERRTRAHERHL